MAIVYTPQYPVLNETVTISLTGATGTEVGYSLIGKPAQSQLDLGLLLEQLPAGTDVPPSVQLAAEMGVLTDEFIPDVQGEYTFEAYDIREIVGSPSFEGDPSGELRFVLVGSQVGTVMVGAYTDLPVITVHGDGATLRLNVNNQMVRGATFVDWTTELARVSAVDASTVGALNTLVGQPVATIGTNLIDGVNDLKNHYEIHRLDRTLPPPPAGSVHHYGDYGNSVVKDDAYSIEFALLLLNELRDAISKHFNNSSSMDPYGVFPVPPPPPPSPPEAWTGSIWHNYQEDDGLNRLLIAPAETTSEATVLLSDLRLRGYARHVLLSTAGGTDPEVHIRHDPLHDLAVPPSLLDGVLVTYLDNMAKINPLVEPGESEGIIDAAHKYGFALYTGT